MNTQILPVIQTVSNNPGSERRSFTNARTRRQRARDLADRQLSLVFFDLEVLETICTLKPPAGKVDAEKVYSTPTFRPAAIYNDSVAPTSSTLVHYLERADRQCAFPTWSDDDMDSSGWMSCGAEKARRSDCYCSHHMQLAYGRKAA
ncbi:GcrA family cell cycle regulator [Aureimonas glaciei]|nr:GcrA family cell cycle regulator [Aureimonas glaciei]